MANTPHRRFRLTDTELHNLRRIAAEVVPDDERPAHAAPGSGWKLTAMLRGIAQGTYVVRRVTEAE